MAPKSIKNIAIVGAGVMGQGIAQVCATAGYPVMLYDIQPDLTRSAIAAIRKTLEAAVGKGKITALAKDEALARIQAVGDFRQLQVDLAIEAVIEKREVKQKILLELEKINALDFIIIINKNYYNKTWVGTQAQRKMRGPPLF